MSKSNPVEHDESWFAAFAGFTLNPDAGTKTNFDRLAKQRKWGNKLKHKRWVECQTAEFDYAYGDATKLECWQALYFDIFNREPPDSITKCKKALGSRKLFVNICNLIDHRRNGTPIITFNSFAKFQKYTRSRTYPLQAAKADGFISALLREIF